MIAQILCKNPVAIAHHRSKLVAEEWLAIEADALMLEENRPSHCRLDHDDGGQHKHQGGYQCQGSHKQVKHPFRSASDRLWRVSDPVVAERLIIACGKNGAFISGHGGHLYKAQPIASIVPRGVPDVP